MRKKVARTSFDTSKTTDDVGDDDVEDRSAAIELSSLRDLVFHPALVPPLPHPPVLALLRSHSIALILMLPFTGGSHFSHLVVCKSTSAWSAGGSQRSDACGISTSRGELRRYLLGLNVKSRQIIVSLTDAYSSPFHPPSIRLLSYSSTLP